MITIHDYFVLWRLARKRFQSEMDYREFQAFQASLIIRYLRRCGLEIAGKLVFDLGSGYGGYSREMVRQGASVLSIDLLSSRILVGERGMFLTGDSLAIPVRTAVADFVFCASLIEHLSDPAKLISEIERVLVPGGFSYLSFPPFLSPTGGHQFSPFHYLGERLAIRLASQRNKGRNPRGECELQRAYSKPTTFADCYGAYGLHVMTIAKARHLIELSGLDIVEMSTRYLSKSFIRWPLLGEVLTWHAQFLLRKPGPAA